MSRPDDDGPDRRFVEVWRRWLERPPRLTPRQAAAAVATRLRPAPAPGWHRWAAAAATCCLLAAVLIVVRRGVAPPAGVVIYEGTVITGPAEAPADEVLLWLDADTPLYMSLQPSGGEAEGGLR